MVKHEEKVKIVSLFMYFGLAILNQFKTTGVILLIIVKMNN